MLRAAFFSTLLIATSVSAPLAAPASATMVQRGVGERNCQQPSSTARSVGRSIFGRVVGRVIGSNSATSTINAWIPAQTMLTDALVNLLDCDEQQRAARATEEVTTQAEQQVATQGDGAGAGTTVAWRSESRPGVSGTSTVTAVDAPASGDGRRCMNVTDVVIIDGEEAAMPKRVCRTPPSTRYARV